MPILPKSEVEKEQRPSGNGDREAIVVGAGLCDGEGERAYTEYAPTLEGESTEKFVRHLRKVKLFSSMALQDTTFRVRVNIRV